MNRGRLVAAVALIGLPVALVGARLTADGPAGPDEVVAATAPSSTAPAPASPITGGEAAVAAGATDGPAAGDPASTTTVPAGDAPPILDPKPELTGLDGWLQSDAENLASFDGQVRVVQFWTFGCYNCRNTLPHLQALYADHHDDGLEIIGVHAPEFDREADPDAIAAAAVDLGVTWPIALDTDKVNFRAWQGSRRFWPRTYVLDRQGRVRFDHIGEGAYDELAATVVHLLAEEA